MNGKSLSANSIFIFLIFSVFILIPGSAVGQETILLSYKQNFLRSDIEKKAEILMDAEFDEQAEYFLGQLYDFSLEFVLHNADILYDDPKMINLAVISVKGAIKTNYKESIDNLWNLFILYKNSLVQTEVLSSLEILGKGNYLLSKNIVNYLNEQNRLRRSYAPVDIQTVSACIIALEKLGNADSFTPIFNVLLIDYPGYIKEQAYNALETIPGDYRQFIIDTILNDSPLEKLTAFETAISGNRLSNVEKGQLAEITLSEILNYIPKNNDEKLKMNSLGSKTSQILTEMQWSTASSLAIRYFYKLQNDFQSGYATKEDFIKAIYFLGAMKTSETAEVAILQLSLINAQTERTGVYDMDITLALINILGLFGSKTAFDHLVYIDYLPYNEIILSAAKEAIERILW